VSQENVEIVRRWVKAETTTPAEIQAKVARFYDPDADYYPARKFPEAQPCHGHDEIVEFLVSYLAAWGRYHYAIQEVIEISDERVLVCGRAGAEGRESRLLLDGDLYYCMWLRHGRCFRQEDHLTMKGALHALGLEGETLEAVGLRK
jgi:hypothetical protein